MFSFERALVKARVIAQTISKQETRKDEDLLLARFSTFIFLIEETVLLSFSKTRFRSFRSYAH